ncbi:TipAS antibiotic-recognition domain-containing protein [Brevibacterium permense]|uniref:TipAS antibiotic-recognition domain-containing protein n=1 Tax=Brevibacterium permense TaxID=234834 RepID=UPI00315A4024
MAATTKQPWCASSASCCSRSWGADAYRRGDEWWSSRSPEGKKEWKALVSTLSEDWIAAAEAGARPESDRCQDLARRHIEWLRAVPGTPADDHSTTTSRPKASESI